MAQEASLAEAARLMALAERQVRRLLAVYRCDGTRALAHRNRGRRHRNALPEGLEVQVVWLAAEQYAGSNQSQADNVAGALLNGHVRPRPPARRQRARCKAIRRA